MNFFRPRDPILTRSQNAARRNNAARLANNNKTIGQYWEAGKPQLNMMKLLTRNIPTATRVLFQGRPTAQNLRNLSAYIAREAGYQNSQNIEKIYRLMIQILQLRSISPNNTNARIQLGTVTGQLIAQLIKSKPKGNSKQQALTKGLITGILKEFVGNRAARLYGRFT
jgi:hypothetical protein